MPMENEVPLTTGGSKSKPEVEFQNGERSFFKLEVVLTESWTEISLPNLVHLAVLTF